MFIQSTKRSTLAIVIGIAFSVTSFVRAEPNRLNINQPDWKKSLEDNGVRLGVSYEADYSKNLKGALSTNGASTRARFTFNTTLDSDKLLGVPGGTLFFQYQNHNGENGADDVGDLQQYDGLDDPVYDRIHMFWYQQYFFNDSLRVKIGKVEPKSEFFGPVNARNHLGFSTERSPTIAHGPPADSVNLFLYPSEMFYLGYGAYDGAFNEGRDENDMRLQSIYGHPADTFHVLEAGVNWNQDNLPGGIKVGGWYLQGTSNRFDGRTEDSTAGGYFVLDQRLYSEDDKQGLGAYFQYGYADEEVRAISQHVGLGFQWTGALAGRDADIFGMGVSRVELTDEPGAGFTENYEAAYELFYKATVTNYLMMMADYQYIENPGGVSRSAANVVTIRVVLTF